MEIKPSEDAATLSYGKLNIIDMTKPTWQLQTEGQQTLE